MGHTSGFTAIGKDSDEAEKRITAKLLAGGQFVVLDNVKHTLDLGPSQARYSGPSSPHYPGQPSAAPWPSNEVMKSTSSSCMEFLLVRLVGHRGWSGSRRRCDE
jgi:hypothetical protein